MAGLRRWIRTVVLRHPPASDEYQQSTTHLPWDLPPIQDISRIIVSDHDLAQALHKS